MRNDKLGAQESDEGMRSEQEQKARASLCPSRNLGLRLHRHHHHSYPSSASHGGACDVGRACGGRGEDLGKEAAGASG